MMYDAAEMAHPLDIRNADRDPANVDLAPFKAAAHAARLKSEAAATHRRHERMRAARRA